MDAPVKSTANHPHDDKKQHILILKTLWLNGLAASADPYIKIVSRTSETQAWKYETEHFDDTPNPRWNLYYSFPLDSMGETIDFTLMDDNGIFPDFTKGSFKVWLKDIDVSKNKEAVSQGTFKVGKATISYFIDWDYQEWPESFPQLSGNQDLGELQKPELFMRGVHFAIAMQINKWTPITCDSIPIPHFPKGKQEVISSLDNYFFVMAGDEDVPIPPEADILIKAINKLPFHDENIRFKNPEEAIAYVHRVFGGIIIDPTEGTWVNLIADDAMTRYFFYNNGSLFMAKDGDGYKCDLDWIYPFPVRDQYLRYGSVSHFDGKGHITHIVYEGKTYKPVRDGASQAEINEWEWAKLVARTTAFIAAAGIHLMQGHLTWSNYPNYAMRTALSPEHPIRRLLHVHFWRSAMVCAKSLQSLIPENGLLHRGTSFDLPGLHSFYKAAIDLFEYETFPENLKKRGMDKAGDVYPVATDAMLFYDVISKYVSNYVDIHYKDDQSVQSDEELDEFWDIIRKEFTKPAHLTGPGTPKKKFFPVLALASLKSVLTEVIFRVSGYHQHIGNALAPIHDPRCISLRLLKDRSTMSPVDSLYVQGLVTMLTSMRMPTMAANGSWLHMFRSDPEKAVYNTFRDELALLSAKIVELNRKRPFKIVDFDPRFTCVSVSS